MKALIVADIHGEYQALDTVLDAAGSGFDVVICPGDFTDMFKIPSPFSQNDVAELVLQKLLSLNKPLLCVPGNQDPHETLGMFSDHNVSIQNKTKDVLGTTFAGWGGALTPFNTLFEPTEEETREALGKLGTTLKPGFVLVVHSPPKDTKMDKTGGGEHVGSQAIREFVLKSKPSLVISAHIHEASGTDKLGSSVLFYPGPVYEGKYGVVDISKSGVKCEIRTVEL